MISYILLLLLILLNYSSIFSIIQLTVNESILKLKENFNFTIIIIDNSLLIFLLK